MDDGVAIGRRHQMNIVEHRFPLVTGIGHDLQGLGASLNSWIASGGGVIDAFVEIWLSA
jgi:hypothetical protein